MHAKLPGFLSWPLAAVVLIAAGTFGAGDVMAGDKHKKDYRRHDGQEYRYRDMERDLNRHERERRAFVAGAAAQQHREYDRDMYRDGYRAGHANRYRERYYDDHDDKVGAALVGAAVGAVVTGVVMSSKNNNSGTTATSSK